MRVNELIQKRQRLALQMLKNESIKVDWHEIIEPGKKIESHGDRYVSDGWSWMVKCRPGRKWVVRIYSLGL